MKTPHKTKEKMMRKINFRYLLLFFAVLAVEILIGLFVSDRIIRPYGGDVLVVVLIYAFLRIFLKPLRFLPEGVFAFAVMVEILQYFHYVEWFGLQNNRLIATIMGESFAVEDMFCYAIGYAMIFALQRWAVLQKLMGDTPVGKS